MRASISRWLPPRLSNLALLSVLLLALATGAGAVATGTSGGRWVVIAHGVTGMAVILLIPWKGRVIRRGLRRVRRARWASLLLALLAFITLVTGVGSSTGLIRSIGGRYGMWVHIAAGLALIPLMAWHALSRQSRPHRTDLSRRVALKAGLLGVAAAGLYVTTDTVTRLTRLPGAQRRFTGSHEIGSFDPASMPSTIWFNDSTPTVHAERWRLTVMDGVGSYQLTLPELAIQQTPCRATLDCTSGWYAQQDWAGVPVSSLIRDTGEARSLLVRSVTGYWIRLPVDDLEQLLLATSVGGEPLARRHGFPLRLVAPSRRGYWWVKWVDRIELQRTPAWWQSPFPLT
jgi:DMSO/TMAO reductase YedYZ molybdopterin-dependent catalytic subunit